MTNNEARTIIEEVIDTLIEVGNGVTDQDLHKECNKLYICLYREFVKVFISK